ncbi:hypothetical protein F441_05429 [Phytophthora nicotianae CJ01A1]|uniref:Uncharacterized protein n=5 Tax=Phytophthora nicotianae TaxID=4792 RepID=V9FKB2_PHYNI|nr:hypothetical protein F443_05423 [Phytophthora nicotianae P1569]ETK91061.1 hypothetical protein L915_05280 [Phytophthora nicotianae]ETO79965.1 hypothetical protein F444_05468 [Phytophthora nicotianae P1976]ETP20985.1 hypothetical protein F441_05429 [Phytophthora nicotianae CJ01A1]ETP48939.1 hypothetical protein F442_05472 [Phytophthora nicotianae P10297]
MEGLADLQFRLATALGRDALSADTEISDASTHCALPRSEEILGEIKTSEVVQETKASLKYRPKTELEQIEHFHRVEFELQNAYYIPIKDRGNQNLLVSRIKEDPSRAGRILRSTTGLVDYDHWRRCNSERINELAAKEFDKLESKDEYVAEADEMIRKLSAEYAKRDAQFRFTLPDSTGIYPLLQAILRDDATAASILGPENPLARFLVKECTRRGPTPIVRRNNHKLASQQLDEATKKRSLEEIEYFHHFPFKLQYGIPIELYGAEGDLSRVREAANNPEAFSTWEEATWQRINELANDEMDIMDERGMAECIDKNEQMITELSQAYTDAGDVQYALDAAPSTVVNTWALALAIMRNGSVAKSKLGPENALGRFLVTNRILEWIERRRIVQE